jgi:hypothetical protein
MHYTEPNRLQWVNIPTAHHFAYLKCTIEKKYSSTLIRNIRKWKPLHTNLLTTRRIDNYEKHLRTDPRLKKLPCDNGAVFYQ